LSRELNRHRTYASLEAMTISIAIAIRAIVLMVEPGVKGATARANEWVPHQ
jgi:hypothetical protein